jgi:hypothetical protein
LHWCQLLDPQSCETFSESSSSSSAVSACGHRSPPAVLKRFCETCRTCHTIMRTCLCERRVPAGGRRVCRRPAPSPRASREGRAVRCPTAARASGATSFARSRLTCCWRSATRIATAAACADAYVPRASVLFAREAQGSLACGRPDGTCAVPTAYPTVAPQAAIAPPRAASTSGWRRWHPSRG